MSKEYLTALVFNKKTGQSEPHVIKTDSSNSKLHKKAQDKIEMEFRRNKRLNEKIT